MIRRLCDLESDFSVFVAFCSLPYRGRFLPLALVVYIVSSKVTHKHSHLRTTKIW